MAVVLGGERGGHRRRDYLDWVEGLEEGGGIEVVCPVVVFREYSVTSKQFFEALERAPLFYGY
jgi:hypothetical protein